MIYVGIDLHRKRSHVAAVDERGVQVLSRRIVNDPDVFEEVIAELGEEATFALEATYGWEWLAQLLEDRGCELHLAHPLRTKAIASARVKTDTSTRARWRTCCAPTCCPRRISHRASSGICAICCASAW
ncbi:MAG TPA: transposase, partial [Candidatus Dormibacteraeota bacterium]|nr:transposase [Candidatus Dormibacteraeota bacterium]